MLNLFQLKMLVFFNFLINYNVFFLFSFLTKSYLTELFTILPNVITHETKAGVVTYLVFYLFFSVLPLRVTTLALVLKCEY